MKVDAMHIWNAYMWYEHMNIWDDMIKEMETYACNALLKIKRMNVMHKWIYMLIMHNEKHMYVICTWLIYAWDVIYVWKNKKKHVYVRYAWKRVYYVKWIWKVCNVYCTTWYMIRNVLYVRQVWWKEHVTWVNVHV